MAVLAIYILLALVGTKACDEQPDAPTSPSPPPASPPPPPPTPAPTTISTTEAACAILVPPTLTPPTHAPFLNRRDLRNASRSRRSLLHSPREPGEDEAIVEFCPLDEKLHSNATWYKEFGSVERWCDYPEDRRETGVDDDEDNDETDNKENSLSAQNLKSLTSWWWSSSSASDSMDGTAVPASDSATPPLGNWLTYAIDAQSALLDILPAPSNPESLLSSSAVDEFREYNGAYGVSQTEDDILTIPSRLPSLASDNQPGASWSDVADHTMENRYHNQSDHIVQSEQGTHQVRQLPAASPEANPGPSGVRSVPSQNTNSTPVRPENKFYGYLPELIYLVDHDTELFDPEEMARQLKDNVNHELERLFGPRQRSESGRPQPDMKPCYGDVSIHVLGTKESPSYVVDMKCPKQNNICPPGTVCSAVYDPLTVDEPGQVPLFKYMRDTWDRNRSPLPTGCFCAPPAYLIKDLEVLS